MFPHPQSNSRAVCEEHGKHKEKEPLAVIMPSHVSEVWEFVSES